MNASCSISIRAGVVSCQLSSIPNAITFCDLQEPKIQSTEVCPSPPCNSARTLAQSTMTPAQVLHGPLRTIATEVGCQYYAVPLSGSVGARIMMYLFKPPLHTAVQVFSTALHCPIQCCDINAKRWSHRVSPSWPFGAYTEPRPDARCRIDSTSCLISSPLTARAQDQTFKQRRGGGCRRIYNTIQRTSDEYSAHWGHSGESKTIRMT
jgi:hypothetical protein